MAVRACGPRRCRDRHNRRATLVVANHDALCAGRNFRCGRRSTAAFLAPDRRARALVDEINRICGRAVVERQVGGGAILTPFGLSLVSRYRKIERCAESAARKELLALLADMGAARKA